MTQTQYADSRGWSASYVSKLKRQGRLVLTPSGSVNVTATDRLLSVTADPARGGDRTAAPGQSGSQAAERPTGAPSAAQGGTQRDLERDAGYRLAATRERLAKARTAEMEMAELAGALVRRDDVERLVFALARESMDKLLALPARLAGQLANEPDQRRCAQLLEDEIRAACECMTRVDELLPLPATANAA
ncbi:MAG: hypothetical protein WA777_01805 [Rhodanobacter sp.]